MGTDGLGRKYVSNGFPWSNGMFRLRKGVEVWIEGDFIGSFKGRNFPIAHATVLQIPVTFLTIE